MIELDGNLRRYRLASSDSEREALNREILDKYNINATLMVLDMSGFARITRDRGIVHFLAMVQQMQEITSAEIEKFGGKVVKFFSDNCFAYFDDPTQGVDCAVSVMRAHNELDKTLEHEVQICIGVDTGEFLLIAGNECFGHTVNRACKLGEDIAGRGELLVSDQTMAAVDNPDKYSSRAMQFRESGLDLHAFLIEIPA